MIARISSERGSTIMKLFKYRNAIFRVQISVAAAISRTLLPLRSLRRASPTMFVRLSSDASFGCGGRTGRLLLAYRPTTSQRLNETNARFELSRLKLSIDELRAQFGCLSRNDIEIAHGTVPVTRHREGKSALRRSQCRVLPG